MEITPLFTLTDFLLATVPAVSFAMLFNVPWRLLWYCAIAGGTGRIIRDISMLNGIPILSPHSLPQRQSGSPSS